MAPLTFSSVPQVSNRFFYFTTNTTSHSASQVTNATALTFSASDCDITGKTYVSTFGTHTEFHKVYCEVDLGGNDYHGVFVYFFNGTETVNAACCMVVFTLDFHKYLQPRGGNYSLRDASDITATHRAYTSAASLSQS